MVDICLCYEPGDCPVSNYCHRATATTNESRQNYAWFKRDAADGSCLNFWPNRKYEKEFGE